MAFPASVHTVHLTRARGGRPKKIDSAKNVVEEHEGGPGGPVLDFGREGGATLHKDGKGWKWIWASEPDGVETLESKDEAKLLYPPAKLIDSSQPTSSTMLQSAERYLESSAADLGEGGSNLPSFVLDELHSASRPSGLDDIYQGRVLEVVHNPRAMMARSVLCFPTGQIGNLLNVSPFLPPSSATVYGRSVSRFIPKSRPALRLPTEILQICSSPVAQGRLDRDATVLAVRLHSYTYLVKLIPNPSYLDDPDDPASYAEIMDRLSCSDTGGRRHVDIALDTSTWCRALLVDDSGAVWLRWEERSEFAEKITVRYRTRQIRPPVGGGGDWYSIAFGTRPGVAIVASRKDLTTLDLENQDSGPQKLLSLEGRTITCMEKTAQARGATYTVVCTTREVMLVDDLRVGPPVLSVAHDYGSGDIKDLVVTVVCSEDHGDSILLSSQSNPLVMVFKLSFDPPARSLADPYCLAIPLASKDKPLHSLAYIRLSRWRQDRKSLCLLGLSANGGLWDVPLRDSARDSRTYRGHGGIMTEKKPVELKVEWDSDIKAMAKDANAKFESAWAGMGSDSRGTKYREYDARWAWLEINSESTAQWSFSTSELEQHLRENEAPFEHFMLVGDLARDVYFDRKSRFRSNALRPLPPVDRPGELDKLEHLDFSRHLSVIGAREAKSLAKLQETFPPLSPNTEYRRRHRSHLLRLALDLSLSRTTLHTEDLSPPPVLDATQRAEDEDDDVARAAQQLTLNDSAPAAITFSILHPRIEAPHQDWSELSEAETANHDFGTTPTMDALQAPTAKSILAEWSLGSDPSAYTWKGWKDSRQPSVASSSRQVRPLPSPRILLAATQPPALQPAASVPTLRPAPVASTQAPQSSQEIGGFVQTQVERGPFGARPVGKKKVKKRVGGF